METTPVVKSKTIIFNVLAVAILVAGYFGYNSHILDPDTADLVAKIMAAVLPLGNIALRAVTKKPLSRS